MQAWDHEWDSWDMRLRVEYGHILRVLPLGAQNVR